MRWLLVLIPAAAGVLSFVVSWRDEDFRSSGLLAGIALSILLVGVLLAMRRPWRGETGAVALAIGGGVALLLAVGMVGLAGGLPELLRERLSLFLSSDDRGLLAIAPLDDGFVAVGHPQTGAAWTSPDGSNWAQAPLPSPLAGLEVRVLASAGGTLWAIAQDDTAAGLLAEVPGLDQRWVAGSRFADEDHGQQPRAAAELGDQLLTFGSTYGNDVIFYRGNPRQALVRAGPEPAGDRGYSARGLGCSDAACVAVGEHWEPAAAIWHTTDGEDWELVHLDRGAVAATGVVPVADGWLAVGHDGGSAVTWRSADGLRWEQDTELAVPDAVFEGVAAVGGIVTVHGHDARSDRAGLWTLGDGGWRSIDLGAPPGSRIRGLAFTDDSIVAAGVVGDSLRAAVWVSTAGSPFRLIELETPGT